MTRIFQLLRLCSIALALLTATALNAREVRNGAVTLHVPGRADATPWVAASGSFVAVAWGATLDGKADVFVAVSRDGGATFGSPVQVNTVAGEARLGGELPPRVALVRRNGATVPDIAVLWTARGQATDVKVARSRDGGKTFTAPAALQAPGAAGDRGWPAVALDQQNRIHAIWLDHRDLAAGRSAGTAPAHAPGAQHDGVAMAQKSGLFYAAVGDAASPERRLTSGVCYCCKTALAAGRNGSLYAAWRHVYPGDLRDMGFTMSTNGGRTFSPVVRVSEDKWAINGCPDDGPALALDSGGGVHLVWPTVIGGATPQGAIFYASTRDGRRFTPRVRVPTLGGPKPMHPQIVVDGRGRIFVAWDETVDGRRVAAMREVRAARNGATTFGDVVMISPETPAMYPMLAVTAKSLVAVWTTVGDPSRVELRAIAVP